MYFYFQCKHVQTFKSVSFLKHSRRVQTWGHEEILALIRIWSDQAIQDCLDGATGTSNVYKASPRHSHKSETSEAGNNER